MKIYFAGICGVMMAPLAVAMQEMGHEVIGSDKGFYPPISTYLKDHHIPILVGFKEEHITRDIDIAVIAALIFPDNPEYKKIEDYGIKKYMGYGPFMRDFVLKEKSIVVAGTYGKTTITDFVALLLENAGYDPSFGIGGLPLNFSDGVKIGKSDWSVVEGDEYVNSRIDYEPRFLFYHPTYLVLNAGKYDHLDIYKTEEDYVNAFKKLTSLVPPHGLIVANANGENINAILEDARDRKILRVQTEIGNPLDGVYARLLSYTYQDIWTAFSIEIAGETYQFETKILGGHNIKNMAVGLALGHAIGIPLEVMQKTCREFLGVRRRLEIRKEEPYMVIDDLAHSPVKAQSSIDALKERFPDRRVIAIFEPHTLSSRLRSSLNLYNGYFTGAAEVLIAPVYHAKSVNESERVTPEDIKSAIGKENVTAFDSFAELKTYLLEQVRDKDILLFMSSGNFGGLLDYFCKKEF